MTPVENRIPARILSIEPMTWLKNSHHLTVQITDGDFQGHTLSFNVLRRTIKFKIGDTVDVQLWFKPVEKNGMTYHWLKGDVLTDIEQAVNEFHNS